MRGGNAEGGRGKGKLGKWGGGEEIRRTSLPHQLLCNPQPPMRPHHTQTRNMSMRHPIRGLLLHLGQHITHDARRVVGRFSGARDVDGDEGELWPGQGVVEVVFHKVVLGQVGDVGVLHVRDIRGVEEADVHGLGYWGGVPG